jgi:hypothetical protein
MMLIRWPYTGIVMIQFKKVRNATWVQIIINVRVELGNILIDLSQQGTVMIVRIVTLTADPLILSVSRILHINT